MSGLTLLEEAQAAIGDDLLGSILVPRADLACLLQLIKKAAKGVRLVSAPDGLNGIWDAALRHPIPLDDLLGQVAAEVYRARGLFPDPNLLALAHAEEAGELTKAVLQEPLENVRKEAIQAAAMALRLVLDGDPSTDAHRERQGLKKLGYSG